jgi:hypothetical protein
MGKSIDSRGVRVGRMVPYPEGKELEAKTPWNSTTLKTMPNRPAGGGR